MRYINLSLFFILKVLIVALIMCLVDLRKQAKILVLHNDNHFFVLAVLNHGFAIPKIKDLIFVSPSVTIVQVYLLFGFFDMLKHEYTLQSIRHVLEKSVLKTFWRYYESFSKWDRTLILLSLQASDFEIIERWNPPKASFKILWYFQKSFEFLLLIPSK